MLLPWLKDAYILGKQSINRVIMSRGQRICWSAVFPFLIDKDLTIRTAVSVYFRINIFFVFAKPRKKINDCMINVMHQTQWNSSAPNFLYLIFVVGKRWYFILCLAKAQKVWLPLCVIQWQIKTPVRHKGHPHRNHPVGTTMSNTGKVAKIPSI